MTATTDDLAPSQDYPIRHFELMPATAEALKKLPAQVLDHSYSYEVFGSWWLIVRYKGIPNGLDRSATKKRPFEWSEVWPSRTVDGNVSSALIAEWITTASDDRS